MKKSALIAIVAALVVCSSGAEAQFGRPTTKRERDAALAKEGISPRSADLYDRIHERFLSNDHPAAERLADEYLARRSPNEAADVRLLRALSRIRLGRMSEAKRDLQALQASGVQPEIREEASRVLSQLSSHSSTKLRKGAIEEAADA